MVNKSPPEVLTRYAASIFRAATREPLPAPPVPTIGSPEDAAAMWGEGSEMHLWAKRWFAEQRGAGPIEILRAPKPGE